MTARAHARVGELILAAGLAATAACSPTRAGDPDGGSGGDGGGGGDGGAIVDRCKVADESLDAPPLCDDRAPAGSFTPEVQWSYTPEIETDSFATPLVANLTDDDGNGVIDLCDVPDIVLVAFESLLGSSGAGHIYLLDGQTGALHRRFDGSTVNASVTPALGDIDGDGIPEIITTDATYHLIAFEHDGTIKWVSTSVWSAGYSGAIALADLDVDGDVEILAGNMVFDHLGNELFTLPDAAGNWSASAIADLDGDGRPEIVLGNAAYHGDGSLYWSRSSGDPYVGAGYPAIANLDDDPEPEVLVTNFTGLTLLDHDGTVKWRDLRPTGDEATANNWLRPATIHDFDADGQSEFASSSGNHYTVYERSGAIVWSATVSDLSGIAAGTAFDFLGDGSAEAMYADELRLFVYDDSGNVLLDVPRTSGTLTEYPVVADVDNDGSAEIVVISNNYGGLGTITPTIQVIRDVEDRWVPARRIWNQHTYHVTNVREDGTIPQHEVPSWTRLNTYRTNAQVGGEGVCEPVID